MTSSTADARYIKAMRLGSRATTASQPFMFEVPTGCVITGLDVSGDSNASVVAYYRPIQIYLNGAWLTVGAA
ncbi:phage tail protein [Hafnia paralvei]|nr:phage tail protein [Hafnia paralvei]